MISTNISFDYTDLDEVRVTGTKPTHDGRLQVSLSTQGGLYLYLTADEALNLSQVFAGLAAELADRDTEVAA